MTDSLIIALWGLLAIGVNTAVGRWCRRPREQRSAPPGDLQR
ncbi:hypothetical protein [Modestobacter versicolor]|uniref:Uncharacterized protein n=1 Tax=Modestobacter versicolor TaxID=429133 RepID=A0A839Y4K0_9ACTN|nr:hypothetical protein [Modestobacter versicolor]MBB3676236.1 hypothetical protein [Modestobacter versicolor]